VDRFKLNDSFTVVTAKFLYTNVVLNLPPRLNYVAFTVVTAKFLYTNVVLNLPPRLNYVAPLPCKCTQRIMHVKPLTICAKKHLTLFRWTFRRYLWHPNIPGLNPDDYNFTRSGLSRNIVSIPDKNL